MPSTTMPPPAYGLPWLTVMLNELIAGVKETPGPGETDAINRYHAVTAAGVPPGDGDETNWCASCQCYGLEKSGIISPRSKSARSFERWGVPIPLSLPRRGAIAVLERGLDPKNGHVGTLLHWTQFDVFLVGGNQGNAVSIARYPRRRVVAFRWPPGVEMPEAA